MGPKGVRVNTVAPGWIETSAQGLLERMAKQAGTDVEAACQVLNEISWRYSYWSTWTA